MTRMLIELFCVVTTLLMVPIAIVFDIRDQLLEVPS
jgi:hypothetical protein